jgi:hypothetical protein
MWPEPPPVEVDFREISTGTRIPTHAYADQPYLTPTLDDGFLCVVTTGLQHEGSSGQHVMSMKTFDLGRSWQDVVAVEDPGGPESSWGVPFTSPSGRIFVFYVYNADNLRELPADDPPYPGGKTRRMDSHGYYAFRWSDDHGKTWSKQRGLIPVREFEIDRRNPSRGKVRLFWNVGKPFSRKGELFLPIHKVGGFGEGWFTSSEGGLLRSADILTASNPLEASWVTLPEGEHGVRSPEGGGPVAEEHSFVTLSDDSLFTVFRTIDGHSACSYSRDGGKSWEPSQYMRFATGRLMKNPRAANFVWKISDGSFLYSFHNHGGRYLREHPNRRTLGYQGRNPLWLCRGWESRSSEGAVLNWSEPELALYDDDPLVRISYPDCVETRGHIYLTETQKSCAKIHQLPPHLAHALSSSPALRAQRLQKTNPILTWSRENSAATIDMPRMPPFVVRNDSAPYGGLRTRAGFAVHAQARIQSAHPVVLAANIGSDGSCFVLDWTAMQTLRIRLSDGSTEASWESDPVPQADGVHRFTINIDGGSCTICFYRDGVLNDGGDARQYGWGRISPQFRNEYSGAFLHLPFNSGASLDALLLYDRVLTSAEAQLLCSSQQMKKLGQPATKDSTHDRLLSNDIGRACYA